MRGISKRASKCYSRMVAESLRPLIESDGLRVPESLCVPTFLRMLPCRH